MLKLFRSRKPSPPAPSSGQPQENKGATRNVTHKPHEHPSKADRKLETLKQALHDFEETKGDWAKSR